MINIRHWLKYSIILLILIVISCSNHSKIKKHEQLIFFKSQFIMDMDEIMEKSDQEFQKLTDSKSFYPETDTIKYLKDTIYISYLAYVNSCAEYSGDIEIRNDSLILGANNLLNYDCASGRIDRFIYKIHNPDNKKYTIVKF